MFFLNGGLVSPHSFLFLFLLYIWATLSGFEIVGDWDLNYVSFG